MIVFITIIVLMVMLSLYCTLLCIWLTEYIFMKCIIFPHSYFSHVLLLRILYIQLQTVKCINCIINCNIVPYSYFPHVLLLHILYIQLQTVKCINCIINCNIVPYSYFPHILLLPSLYIHTHQQNFEMYMDSVHP